MHTCVQPNVHDWSKEARVMIGIQGHAQTLGSKLFGSKSEIRGGNPDYCQWRQLFCLFSTAKLISAITKNAKNPYLY